MQKKTFEEWEKSKNRMAIDSSRINTTKQITEEEFEQMHVADTQNWRTVMYKDRVQFLKANGYDVNRENLLNAELSAKPAEG